MELGNGWQFFENQAFNIKELKDARNSSDIDKAVINIWRRISWPLRLNKLDDVKEQIGAFQSNSCVSGLLCRFGGNLGGIRSSFHLIQLALHDIQLPLNCGSRSGGGLRLFDSRISKLLVCSDQRVSLAPSRFHFVELPLHYVELSLDGRVSQSANTYADESKNGYYNSGIGKPSAKFVLGCFFLLFGAIFTKFFIYCCNEPDKPRWLFPLTFLIGSIAAGFTIQGTILVLSGNWLP